MKLIFTILAERHFFLNLDTLFLMDSLTLKQRQQHGWCQYSHERLLQHKRRGQLHRAGGGCRDNQGRSERQCRGPSGFADGNGRTAIGAQEIRQESRWLQAVGLHDCAAVGRIAQRRMEASCQHNWRLIW